MPIYEYQCKACGNQTEFLEKITDTPKTECPNCAAHELTRLVSAAGFQLKGTGWYVTDFRDKGKAPEKQADTPKAATPKTETPPKKDTKD